MVIQEDVQGENNVTSQHEEGETNNKQGGIAEDPSQMDDSANIRIDMSPLTKYDDVEIDGITNPSNINNVTPPDFDDMAGTSMKSTFIPQINVEQMDKGGSKKQQGKGQQIGKLAKAKNQTEQSIMSTLIQNILANRLASNFKEAKLKELNLKQLLEEDLNVARNLYQDDINKQIE